MEKTDAERLQLTNSNLRKTLGKMEVALGSINEAIAWTDRDGSIQWCNTPFDTMVGLRHLAVLGKRVDEIFIVKEVDATPAADEHPLDILKRGEDFHQRTYSYAGKDGEFLVDVSGSSLLIGDENIFIFFIQDVTELKLSQGQLQAANINLEKRVKERTEELQAVSNRHQAILDCAVDAIITIDAKGIVSSMNPAVERLFGYCADDLIGKNVNMIMPEPHHSNHDGYLERYIKTGKSAIIGRGREVVGRKKNGDLFPLDLSVSEVRVGSKILFTGILRDISNQKEIMVALQAAKEQAEEASRAKSDFLARISHEIRTPLNAILGMADLLLETPLSPEQKKYVQVSRGSGDHLLNIINDLLDVSRIEAGKFVLDSIPFNLVELVEVVLAIITSAIGDKNIQVRATIDENIPAYIKGDPKRLRQILINLMGNSVKFTEKGEILLNISRGDEDRGKEVIELFFEVADTGIGIHPDQQKSIFESFTQADQLITRKYGGTGLGLNISQSLVELMHGRIRVESTLHQGSVFSFSARFKECRSDELSVATAHAEKQTPPRRETEPGKSGGFDRHLRILLAEDSSDNRLLFAVYLKKMDCTLDLAENGRIAVEKFLSGTYDIVIMDVQMPEMDGYTATGIIRAHEKKHALPPVPIIALTAHAQESDRMASLAAGCNMHVVKPVSKKDFVQAITDVTFT